MESTEVAVEPAAESVMFFLVNLQNEQVELVSREVKECESFAKHRGGSYRIEKTVKGSDEVIVVVEDVNAPAESSED